MVGVKLLILNFLEIYGADVGADYIAVPYGGKFDDTFGILTTSARAIFERLDEIPRCPVFCVSICGHPSEFM